MNFNGFIQAHAIDEDENNYFEENFDDFLQSKGFETYRNSWRKLKKDGATEQFNRTTQTYIRNFIHHPENTHNEMYSDEELKKSIDKMINLLKEL